MTGTLISIEGPDGAGKTTVWESLKERDEFETEDIVWTREPSTDTWYGDSVYKSLEDDNADSLAELFLYLADHANHLSSVILPALENGKVVVTDRYVDSRIAYQAATLGEDDRFHFRGQDEFVEYIYKVHDAFTRWPDTTVYCDVSPEVGVQRSDKADKFEEIDHIQSVVSNYTRLYADNPERFELVETEELTPDEVEAEVADIIRDAV